MKTVSISSVAESGSQNCAGIIGSAISDIISSRSHADILHDEVSATIGWSSTNGSSIMHAQMCPVILTHSATGSHKRPTLSAYICDQPHTVRYPNGKSFPVSPRELVVVRPGVEHQTIATRPFVTSGLVIDLELFRSFVLSEDRVIGRRFGYSHGLQCVLANIIDSCVDLSRSGQFAEGGEPLTRSFLEVLAVIANQQPLKDSHVRSDGLEIRRLQVKSMIDKYFREADTTIAWIASQLGISARYIQLAFEGADESPSAYLRDRRLKAAACDLHDDNLRSRSITEICFQNGFNSSSHFSSEFRRHFGMTPREWRSSKLRMAASDC